MHQEVKTKQKLLDSSCTPRVQLWKLKPPQTNKQTNRQANKSKKKKQRRGGELSGKGFGNLVIEFIFTSSCCYPIIERVKFCFQKISEMTVERKSNKERRESRGVKLLRDSTNIEHIILSHFFKL